MLDEEEFGKFRNAVLTTGKIRGIEGWLKPQLDAYEQMTGHRETNINAIFHHRVSLYGPPCAKCAKPLRTPKATFCAYCGDGAVDTDG
jgi:hypothetical protein